MAKPTRYRPRRSLRSLQDEVDRVFESFFPSVRDEDADTAMTRAWTPRMDVTETEGAYRLSLDLPGMDKDGITVRMEDNRLVIRGERREETITEEEDVVHTERSFGSFYRSLRLPQAVRKDEIEAAFENGVLTIDLPKTEVSTPKQVEIR